ncbi:MAG: endonuclease III [Bacteroidales bacterium]
MIRKELYSHVLDWFEQNMPLAKSELNYQNAYELLVAVILSAQCTDKRVNIVTPAFFKRFPNVQSLSESNSSEIFEYIRSISYPNNKSKHLLGMAKMLIDEFHGEIPSLVEDMMRLPGVGRKTAHVIASIIYHQPTMAVDTHVFRVSSRIGLSKGAKTPLETEKQLMRYIPLEKVGKAHHWLILHGRYVCKARNPKCETCGLRQWCSYANENRE